MCARLASGSLAARHAFQRRTASSPGASTALSKSSWWGCGNTCGGGYGKRRNAQSRGRQDAVAGRRGHSRRRASAALLDADRGGRRARRDGRSGPVRVLGEDLVLYRDKRGTYGLLERRCPHRQFDLSYGMVEECGIRCSYHGWRFDEAGRCLEQPFEETVNPGTDVQGANPHARLSGAGEGGAPVGVPRSRPRLVAARLGGLLQPGVHGRLLLAPALQLGSGHGRLLRSRPHRVASRSLVLSPPWPRGSGPASASHRVSLAGLRVRGGLPAKARRLRSMAGGSNGAVSERRRRGRARLVSDLGRSGRRCTDDHGVSTDDHQLEDAATGR